MDRSDDPEKRIAGLEHGQGRASAGRPLEQPPAYPAPEPSWQQAAAWQQPPPAGNQPPVGQSGNGSPPDFTAGLPAKYRPIPSGPTLSQRLPVGVKIVGIVLVSIVLLGFAGVFAYGTFEYAVGTPTTAKVSDCSGHTGKRSRVRCTGSWTIDGTTHYGRIMGARRDDIGMTVDVRATGKSASTQRALVTASIFAAACGVGALIVVPLAGFWFIRKTRRPT